MSAPRAENTASVPDAPDEKSFGERVVERMHELKITTTELSRRSGVSAYVVRNLHSGRRKTTGADNAQKLIKALGLDQEEGAEIIPAPQPAEAVPPYLSTEELALLEKAVDLYDRVNQNEKPFEVKALKKVVSRLKM